MKTAKNKLVKFDITAVAAAKNCSVSVLISWLKRKGHPYNFKKQLTQLPESTYKKIFADIEEGVKFDFNLSDADKKRLSKDEISRLNKVISNCRVQIMKLEEKINNEEKIRIHKEITLKRELDLIRQDLLLRKPNHNPLTRPREQMTLKEKSKEIVLQLERLKNGNKSKLSEFKTQLKKLDRLRQDSVYKLTELIGLSESGAKKVDENILSLKRQKVYADFDTTARITVPWNDIAFSDGYLLLKHPNHLLKPYPFKQSKKAFNSIKSLYKFRNAPALEVLISNTEIRQIENVEIVTYYLKFLGNLGTNFDNDISENTVLQRHSHHTKSFYEKHLPNLMLSRCFQFLCERANEELPIIPIPETVINGSGITQIHESFLFPVLGKEKILWVWESIQESKATYIFQTELTNFTESVQTIFDYLTGDVVNKRETLVSTPLLRSRLNNMNRIYHSKFNSWKDELLVCFNEMALKV